MPKNIEDQIAALSLGNVGAITVLTMMERYYPMHFQECFDKLQKAKLRGNTIWEMYGECHQSLITFVRKVQQIV